MAPVLLCFVAASLVPRAAQVVHRHAAAPSGHVHPWESTGSSDLSHLLAHLRAGDEHGDSWADHRDLAERHATQHDEAAPQSHGGGDGVRLVYANGHLELAPLAASGAAAAPRGAARSPRQEQGAAHGESDAARPSRRSATRPLVTIAAAAEAAVAHVHWQSPYQVVARSSAPQIAGPTLVVAVPAAPSAREAAAPSAPTRARSPPSTSLS